jgi:hypothetical protein
MIRSGAGVVVKRKGNNPKAEEKNSRCESKRVGGVDGEGGRDSSEGGLKD